MSVANGVSVPGFATLAKSLIVQTQSQPAIKKGDSVQERLNTIELLEETGMSPRYALQVLKDIIDDCGEDDKSIKLQAAKLLIQVHGMLSSEEVTKAAPVFNLVIQGDNVKVNTMLCPNAG